MASAAPTSGLEAAAGYLLERGLLLTALELKQELTETGQAVPAQLTSFFDAQCFPANIDDTKEEDPCLQRGSDAFVAAGKALHAPSASSASDRRSSSRAGTNRSAEQRVALLEYEVRIAKEELEVTKMRLSQMMLKQQRTDLTHTDGKPTGAEAVEVDGEERSDQTGEAVTQHFSDADRDSLNGLVWDYLHRSGYKHSAVTFSDETGTAQPVIRHPSAHLHLERLVRPVDTKAHPVADLCHALRVQEELRRENERLKGQLVEVRESRGEPLRTSLEGENAESSKTSGESTLRDGVEGEVVLDLPAPPLMRGDLRVTERDEERLIELLAQCLPNIAPFVLIPRRAALVPLLVAGYRLHSSPSARLTFLRHLIRLLPSPVVPSPSQATPTPDQRLAILRALVHIASAWHSAPEGETEALTVLADERRHASASRRQLVADAVGLLGRFCSARSVRGVLIPLVQVLAADPAVEVRAAALTALARLLVVFDPLDDPDGSEAMLEVLLDLMVQYLREPTGETAAALRAVIVRKWQRMKLPASFVASALMPRVMGYARETARRIAAGGVTASEHLSCVAQLTIYMEFLLFSMPFFIRALAEELNGLPLPRRQTETTSDTSASWPVLPRIVRPDEARAHQPHESPRLHLREQGGDGGDDVWAFEREADRMEWLGDGGASGSGEGRGLSRVEWEGIFDLGELTQRQAEDGPPPSADNHERMEPWPAALCATLQAHILERLDASGRIPCSVSLQHGSLSSSQQHKTNSSPTVRSLEASW
ncbi:unnamed protein product [Vitrella brassicaformis CCMP3155]|uniref:Uncharacterized protein n=1 Tax=Vitrella brassicaformis (strain CCMP3155) TaxID=1169540 RepID=A0A0G4GZJ9_VITBC|nr:unnamed protein product [Vitrella brassicaformis CCMP3155]|eukprot:CEM36455.1 unnamed protein product [Vitrella brassicaformis CCMP3155]